MGVWRWIQGWVLRKGKHDVSTPHSVVLLLQEATFFSAEEIEHAGELGFGVPFDGETNPMYFVVQKHGITFVKAGPYVLNVLHAAEPYLGDVEYVAKQLPQQEQRAAWQKHAAWVAIDLFNKEVPPTESYAVLARLALGLGDDRCVGMYLPKFQVMAPNDGSMEEGLRQMVREAEIRMV